MMDSWMDKAWLVDAWSRQGITPLVFAGNGTDGDVGELEKDAYEGLAASYAFVGIVALVQLARIQLRVPEYGWTTQKVFHLFNFVLCAARCVVFLFWEQILGIDDYVLKVAILDVPSLFFFTTYTLLILFWAEIYHQARGVQSEDLRRTFCILNAAIYILQACAWIYMEFVPQHAEPLILLTKLFRAGVAFTAAFGFMLYGGRLFVMLNTFPVESRGRRNKLMEVGCVTAIGFTSFTIRAFIVAFSSISERVPLDEVKAPVFNVIYYMAVEVVPTILVLYILRKLPPRRRFNTQPLQ
ncbi:unnamed protein product [Closterium sp. Yama58-4]|nr:unnamed protein product [Closterium sp. Yama58-4]